MKNSKYKIVVLSDLKKSAITTLKSSVSLAHMIDADIELFHVKKHVDIIKRDNQLSAMRSINEEFISTKNKIKALIDPVSKAYDIPINSNFSFGNIKDEIRTYIKDTKPDIIVLGQRDSKPLKFIGDSITHFLLKEFNGVVMISSNEHALVPNEKMTLGVLNGSDKTFKTELSKDLITHTQSPLKSFKVINSQNTKTESPSNYNEDTLEFVFEKNDNTIPTLSSYLLKNNINLLCVDRDENSKMKNKNASVLPLKETVNKLNVSLLVSGAL
ncbi:universal stress protein [Winogradskyella eximia]|uniref:universal stress protein n=1 Tax=Winogradskyella eximia TaxID=262006 RepID=UPI0024915819|nr:universal stress protein [Winogradskyella eximia]